MKFTIKILGTTAATLSILAVGLLVYSARQHTQPTAELADTVPVSSIRYPFNRPPLALAGVRPFLGRWPRRRPQGYGPLVPLDQPSSPGHQVPAFLWHEPITSDQSLVASEPAPAEVPAAHQVRILDDNEISQLATIEPPQQTPSDRAAPSALMELVESMSSQTLQGYQLEQSLLNGALPAPATSALTLQQSQSTNQVSLQQQGELNSLALLMLGENNYLEVQQRGSANLIGGIGGDAAFQMTGINGNVSLIQSGSFNQIHGYQQSSDSIIRVEQTGRGNIAIITQR
ncbi:hypothetical protein [Aliidiomarina soli]|uniref:Uncharacterized protein n=1 Tax=Aliidiomarina soli TaxID=1928574 RepID=A0A432WHE1_9GAMM|nr:hypothetical protein [Aliidiomarina soli]RUO33198.1 hypothetical protein CWE14_08220 [Aliidiomarina soli]